MPNKLWVLLLSISLAVFSLLSLTDEVRAQVIITDTPEPPAYYACPSTTPVGWGYKTPSAEWYYRCQHCLYNFPTPITATVVNTPIPTELPYPVTPTPVVTVPGLQKLGQIGWVQAHPQPGLFGQGNNYWDAKTIYLDDNLKNVTNNLANMAVVRVRKTGTKVGELKFHQWRADGSALRYVRDYRPPGDYVFCFVADWAGGDSSYCPAGSIVDYVHVFGGTSDIISEFGWDTDGEVGVDVEWYRVAQITATPAVTPTPQVYDCSMARVLPFAGEGVVIQVGDYYEYLVPAGRTYRLHVEHYSHRYTIEVQSVNNSHDFEVIYTSPVYDDYAISAADVDALVYVTITCPTPTPVTDSNYCAYVSEVTSSNPLDDLIVIGVKDCYVFEGIDENVLGLTVNLPGFTVCLVPISFGTLDMGIVKVDMDFIASTLGGIFVFKYFNRLI